MTLALVYYNDHEPPHFHAEHQGLQGKFDFNGELLVGAIESRTALRLIREWAALHRGELEEDWRLAKLRQPLRQIAPLEWEWCHMTILPAVVKAEYRGDYRIHLVFNDGTAKTVDFQPWFDGPIFEPLRDQRYFRDFFVAGSTVCWPNGADIAPETLYAATDVRRVA